MRSRPVAFLLVAAAVLLAASAARSDAATTKSQVIPLLRVSLDTPITILEEGQEAGGEGTYIEPLAVEQLMKFGPQGQVEPNIAQSVTNPGRAVYVYHIRHGITFSDGNPLTADDVANALNYYRYPGTQLAHYYSSVKSITAVNRYTVAVTLKHPDASWPPITASFAMIFEKKFQQAHKSSMGKPGTLIVGSGPWIIDSFDPTSGIELSANPHYWGGPVNIKHISVHFITTTTQEALAFRAGQIDYVPFVYDAQSFEATSGGARLLSAPSCTIGLMSMNTKTGPFADVHVRRAVAYAVNRADVIKASGAQGTPITTLIPPSQLVSISSQGQVQSLLKSLPQYPLDLAKAKAELAKSAYPHGFSTKLDATDFGNFPVLDQAIAGNLAKIGITVKVNDISTGAWLAEYFGPRDQIGLFFTTFGCASPDPSYYPQIFLGTKNARPGASNIADYTAPEVDTLLTQGVTISNKAKRFAIYSQLLKKIATDVPYVPLYVQNSNAALSSKFSYPTYNSFESGAWALQIKAK
jgi:peptide/nickel transport system substrate-binding protein